MIGKMSWTAWGLLGAVMSLPAAPTRAALAAPPELVVIVHPSNPVESLDEHELQAIFTSRQRFWPNGKPLVAFNAPPRTPDRVHFDQSVLHMDPDAAGRFWVDQQVRGGARPPRKAPSATLAAATVRRLPTAIAYVSADACVEGVRVAALVHEGRVVPVQNEEQKKCPD